MAENTASVVEVIGPLWVMDWASLAGRLCEFQPCRMRNLVKWLNWMTEKPAASEAYLPSFPTIPTPTFHCQMKPKRGGSRPTH